jgi:hypothetical protein
MGRWRLWAAHQHKICSGGGTNETIGPGPRMNPLNSRSIDWPSMDRGCNNQLFWREGEGRDTTILLQNLGHAATRHNN